MGKTQFIWDPLSDNVLQEKDEFGATQVTYSNEPSQFGNLISQRRGGETSYYHFDGLGSTRKLTDSSENVTDTNIYDAWGVDVASSGSTVNPYKWRGAAGYQFDREIDSDYVRARSYISSVGRWSTPDPLAFAEGPNKYRAYFIPQTSDPSGLMSKDAFLKCIEKAKSDVQSDFNKRLDRAKKLYRKHCGSGYDLFSHDLCKYEGVKGFTEISATPGCVTTTVFCPNNIGSCPMAERVYLHEWAQAANACLACKEVEKSIPKLVPSKERDCFACLCAEIQAITLGGGCSKGGEFDGRYGDEDRCIAFIAHHTCTSVGNCEKLITVDNVEMQLPRCRKLGFFGIPMPEDAERESDTKAESSSCGP